MDDFDNDFLRLDIQRFLSKNVEYEILAKELKCIERLFSDFGFLSFGRDFITIETHVFSQQKILCSIELTIGNIIECCNAGCIADANTLLRKLRDDLFFYLYILVFDETKSMGKEAQEMEENIKSWIQGKAYNLRISTVLQEISSSIIFSDVVKKYDFKASFDRIGRRLNNYVHSNGFFFYNDNTALIDSNKYFEQVKQLIKDLKYITICFFVLLSICCPQLISSDDYLNYLEMGEMPPEGSQYFVVPFIKEFIYDNYTLIDKNCLKYLQDNTCMDFCIDGFNFKEK